MERKRCMGKHLGMQKVVMMFVSEVLCFDYDPEGFDFHVVR